MVEATATSSKAKAAKPAQSFPEMTAFPPLGMPKFEMPNFEMPNIEVPAAFRDLAEKGIAQAKDGYEKMKLAAEEATDLLEETYTTASKGMSEYTLKMIEAARANANASFDFATELFGAKSMSEMIELSTAHARKQFEAISAQSKDLTSLAQKVATSTAEPIKDSVSKAFNKAA